MRKTIIIAFGVVAIAFSCKSKKIATIASSESADEERFMAVKTRFPDATKEELQKGYYIYTGACTKCHGTKDITNYTEPRLLEIVDDMSKKANITSEEKQALIRFAVGVRATAK